MLASCHDCNSLQVEIDCAHALGGHFEYQVLGLFGFQGSLPQDPAKQILNRPASVLEFRAVILIAHFSDLISLAHFSQGFQLHSLEVSAAKAALGLHNFNWFFLICK